MYNICKVSDDLSNFFKRSNILFFFLIKAIVIKRVMKRREKDNWVNSVGKMFQEIRDVPSFLFFVRRRGMLVSQANKPWSIYCIFFVKCKTSKYNLLKLYSVFLFQINEVRYFRNFFSKNKKSWKLSTVRINAKYKG